MLVALNTTAFCVWAFEVDEFLLQFSGLIIIGHRKHTLKELQNVYTYIHTVGLISSIRRL